MEDIVFRHVSYNVLRDYITSRRMYFNCRLNMWSDLIITVGVYYKGFLCGGVLVSTFSEDCKIECWYSRDGRGKLELLDYIFGILKLFKYNRVYMKPQKKWISVLLNDGWKNDCNMIYKELA